MGDVYLWRQVLILTSLILYSINSGLIISFPSVLGPALLKTNGTDIKATSDEVSWISTCHGLAGAFGFFILSPILQMYGRKAAFISGNLIHLTGWIIFPFAQSIPDIYIARILQGITTGCYFINSIILSEYSDPKRRGYFITLKKSGISVGTLLCHALSIFWDWRQISTFGTIFPIIAIVMTLFWPESPAYLALKGRFIESEKSYVWLHGSSKLQELYLFHSSLQEIAVNSSSDKWYTFVSRKVFLKPLAIVAFLSLINEVSGLHYFGVYVIQMMIILVGDRSLAIYFSVGADVLVIVALLCSGFVIRLFRRRTILFSFGSTIAGLMLITSLVLVFKSPTMPWVAATLIILNCFTINISILPLSATIAGEIFPLQYKGWGSGLSGITFTLLYSLFLKTTSILMENTGISSVYAIYGIILWACLFVLYYIVPETKDKTLQEIENEFRADIKK